jgi:hypothetical protein
VIRMDMASTRDLVQVRKRLQRAGDGRTGRRARRRLVTASPTVVRRVQTAVRAVEVGSSRGGTARPDTSTNLRARIAAAIEHQGTADGVTIYVAGWQLGRNGSRLAQYLDTEDLPRWRHPVFASAARVESGAVRWVTQTGSPYFYVTIRAADGHYEQALDGVMAKIVREICS